MFKILIIVVSIVSLVSCKKNLEVFEPVPSIIFDSLSYGDNNELKYYGFIVENGLNVNTAGICWSDSNQTPTIDDNFNNYSSSSLGSTYMIGSCYYLDFSKKYYFRLYAITEDSTIYSDVLIYSTGPGWNDLNSGIYLNYYEIINTLCFFDKDKAVMGGNYGKYISTENGGDLWEDNSWTSGEINQIQFTDELTGYISYFQSNDKIKKTTDGGETWNILSTGGLSVDFIYCYSNDLIYVFSQTNSIRKSIDGGSTWSLISIDFNNSDIEDVHFYNSNIGYVITAEGKVYKTSDGGVNWQLKNTSSLNYPTNNIHFFNENEGIVSSGYDLYKTINGGSTWSQIYQGTDGYISLLEFLNNDFGIMMANYTIYKTENGGDTWEDLNSPATNNIYGFHSINIISEEEFYIGYAKGVLVYR